MIQRAGGLQLGLQERASKGMLQGERDVLVVQMDFYGSHHKVITSCRRSIGKQMLTTSRCIKVITSLMSGVHAEAAAEPFKIEPSL